MLPEGHQNQLKVGFAYHKKIVLFASMIFLFILEALFVLQIFKSLTFCHVAKRLEQKD